MKSFLRAALILTLFFYLGGCLRYVPARESEDPAARGSFLGFGEGGEALINDESAFYRREREEKNRLQALLTKRRNANSITGRDSYHIGPGDLIQVAVFDVEELNLSVRVRPSGEVYLPLIGGFQAAGLTEADFEREVATRLLKYVYQPQVTTYVTEFAAHKVSVIGQVAQPGTYPLTRDSASILQLISQAGGSTSAAGSVVVLIPGPDLISKSQGQAEAVAASVSAPRDLAFGTEIYYEDLIGGNSKPPLDVPVLPGDTIVVQPAGTVTVDGEVLKPGSFQPSARMTLLGSIASAGGLTYSADVHQVEVVRDIGGGTKAYITADLEQIALQSGRDIRLRDGDVVRVPSNPSRFATRQLVEIVNRFVDFTVGGTVRVAQ